jgi:chromosome segregation ATPase
VDARNGRRAQQLQDEIKGLTEELDSWRRAEERVESTLGGTPRLCDRNRFVNSLLNGELATVEHIAPLWQERRRYSREIARVERQLAAKRNKLGTVVRRGLEADDSGYRALEAGHGFSCWQWPLQGENSEVQGGQRFVGFPRPVRTISSS